MWEYSVPGNIRHRRHSHPLAGSSPQTSIGPGVRGVAASSEKSTETGSDPSPLQKKRLKAAGGRSANSVVSRAQVKTHCGWGKGKDKPHYSWRRGGKSSWGQTIRVSLQLGERQDHWESLTQEDSGTYDLPKAEAGPKQQRISTSQVPTTRLASMQQQAIAV